MKKLGTYLKVLLTLSLVLTLVFGDASNALAARTGGRIGGGSFRAPTRTYSPPAGGGYSSPGGGIGFPFLFPFFGFGGAFGGLFAFLVLMAILNLVISSLRPNQGDELGTNTQVTVAEVQVALAAQARNLQLELDAIAREADTASDSGRAMILQETTLALLRHPEYWVYGSSQSQQTYLAAAEAKFNQWSLTERSKVTTETLVNVNNQLRQAEVPALAPETGLEELPASQYILVTIIVGVDGKLSLPKITNEADLKQALQQIGAVGSDRLLALEVLWTPQTAGDTLTRDDLLAAYPDLRLI